MSGDLTIRIVAAIAEEKGIEPTELDYSLHDYVDTDAVQLLAESEADAWTLSFEIPDGSVTVTGFGGVHVALDGETRSPAGETTSSRV